MINFSLNEQNNLFNTKALNKNALNSMSAPRVNNHRNSQGYIGLNNVKVFLMSVRSSKTYKKLFVYF